MRPALTVNRSFMRAFLAADPPCFALGMVEERQEQSGFLALRPGTILSPDITNAGFRFGHALLGTADYAVVQFVLAFYGFETYNALVNPANPLVQTVLTTMVTRGDYVFFALDTMGSVTAFWSERGQTDVAGLASNLPRIQHSHTTEAQYRRAVSQFARHPDPAGMLLQWVCHETMEYVNLTTDRLTLTPVKGQ